ncbi:MAG: response regulator transcription factor [Chloroflexi bacterium]|nr:response regulator transcription factor [Chloroflexota bacterium]
MMMMGNAPGIEVVGEASNGIEALCLVEEFAPDVLLLDVEMPQMTGLEVIRRLQAARSLVSILVLSAYDDWPYIQGMLETGAAGYLTKAEAPELIVEAVRGVARGEQGWIGRQVAQQILAWPSHILREPVQIALTEQEKAVLRLVVDGKTNREIGRALNLSKKLVETYLETMFAKLGATSRTTAIKRARQEGIIPRIP